jgi:hypothetical protein
MFTAFLVFTATAVAKIEEKKTEKKLRKSS